MSRYYFHIEDGRVSRDETGTELRSLAEARVEATRSLGAVLQHTPAEFWEGELLKVTVDDDQGLTLFVVTVYVDYSAAVMRPSFPH